MINADAFTIKDSDKFNLFDPLITPISGVAYCM